MTPPRILVADDDAWILRMVTTVLEKRGYEVITAVDGEEAYEKAIESPPNLVITDVMMPSMDGWTLIKALRARPEFAFVPVIFLTALSGDDDRIRGFRLGADDYLPKPFRFEELDLRVAKTLERIQLLEEATRARLDGAPMAPIDPAAEGSGRLRAPGSQGRALEGSLEEVGLSALLTLLEMERKTGVLAVERLGGDEPVVARLFLRNGRVLCAEVEGLDEPRNELCVYFMLEWSSGQFAFEPGPVERPDEIKTSTTYLLMEGARRLDEREAGA